MAALWLSVACEPAPEPGAGEAAAPVENAQEAAAPDADADDAVTMQANVARTTPTAPRVATLEHNGETFDATFGGRGHLPADFPDDVPILAQSEPQSSFASPERGHVVHLRTGAESGYVFDYYRKALGDHGWQEESTTSHRGDHEMRMRKGNRVTRVTIRTDGTTTMVLLAVGEDRS